MNLLVNPPSPPGYIANRDTMGGFGQVYAVGGGPSLPPMDLAYGAGLLLARDLPVQVLDCVAEGLDPQDAAARIASLAPERIFLRTSLPTLDSDRAFAADLKERVRPAMLAAFGPYVSFRTDEVATGPYDILVLAELEQVVVELARGDAPKDLRGLWYRDGDAWARTAPAPVLEDLDSLPFPAWQLMAWQGFSIGELSRGLQPMVPALASRGCPYGCHYCPYPVAQGRKWRTRSPQNVADEFRWLKSELGVKFVLFRDPEFTLRADRTIELCAALQQADTGIRWRCETRIDTLDERQLEAMAAAGCTGINMGVESIDDDVLKAVGRKPFPTEMTRRIVGKCKELGIDTFCFFILGLPGESRSSALKLIDFAVNLEPTHVQFTVATPYAGTKLREWAEERKYIAVDSSDAMTSYNATMRNENLDLRELEALKRLADRQWIMRPGAVKDRIRRLGPLQPLKEFARHCLLQVDRARI